MGIKKYSGLPGLDGKFASHRNALHVGMGKPSLTDCIVWFKNDGLESDKWNNYVETYVRWDKDKTDQYDLDVFVWSPEVFISAADANTDCPVQLISDWNLVGIEWDSETTYNTDDYCTKYNKVYKSLIDANTGNIPHGQDSTTEWEVQSINWWNLGSSYNTGNYVLYPSVFRSNSNNNFIMPSTGGSASWDEIMPEYWDSTKTYSSGSYYVWYNGSVWRSIQAGNLNNPPNEGAWWTKIITAQVPAAYNFDSPWCFPPIKEYNHLPHAGWECNYDYAALWQGMCYTHSDPSFYDLKEFTAVTVCMPNGADQGNNAVIMGSQHWSIACHYGTYQAYSVDNLGELNSGVGWIRHEPAIVVFGYKDDDTAYIRVNGVEMNTANTGTLGLHRERTFGLGGVNTADWMGQCNLFDLLLYNKKKSSSEIEAIEGFFLGKWGIDKLRLVTVTNAGNSMGNGSYLGAELSSTVTLANNVTDWDDGWENILYTFTKTIEYNSTLDQWEIWHDYTEDFGPLPGGEVEGRAMQYVVSNFFSMTDSGMGYTHYLMYNEDDVQWEFWMYNEWDGDDGQQMQQLLTYVATGLPSTVPQSGWSNVSGISSFNTTPTISTNF
jgi:hypothetical protein